MIHLAIAQIVNEMNAYVRLRSGVADKVAAGSLYDLLGGPNTVTKDHIAVQIVNVEESVYRSTQTHRARPDGMHERVRPSVRVNVYILFVANLAIYDEALKALSLVIAFFQNRTSLDIAGNGDAPSRVIFELYSMTFEQQNHLWASLGAKYMPSVVYKAAVVDIHDSQVHAEVPPVEQISTEG